MSSTYTNVVFSSRQPDMETANKLNKLVGDLSSAISSGGGGAGTGDMTKAVYDTNANGVVDTCDALAWGKLTGVPATFPPDATAMLKSVYDTNGDGISDHAALADAVAWTGVTGKPATFPPDATAMLKSVYDTNSNNVVDTCDSLAWGKLTGVPSTFPPDSTAMLKSVYDTNGDGISDHAALADTAPWTGISGKPATFPPDSTAMLKSVYDVNNDGIADHAALADTATNANAVPWTGVTGVPASFTPSAHAATHKAGGADAIPLDTLAAPTDITTLNASATAHGLLPKLANTATKFFRDDGTWQAIGGGGDMLKSTYDTNNNGVVDTADSIPWASVTGKPTGNLVDPGTWTNLSLGTGWTAPTQAQYRVEVNGAVSTVRFRGAIQGAYSALGTTAFTAPVGAQPSMTRSSVLAGAQATGTPSDVASYVASVSSAGVCTIYFLGAGPFVWADPAQTQQVYLDGLSYSL